MKAINIQRRRLMTSLALSALAAAPGAAWAQTAAKALASARGARIVVVGAGVGGATAAKYLKLFNKNLDVTLIDRNPNFIRHYGSSELITGAVTMEDLTVSYDALSDRYGVRVVRDTIVGLDADRRTVIGEKGRYAYDKLIVSPGIELVIGGEKAAVDKAAELAKQAGARRCIPLKVSGPFHTRLMAPAGDALAKRFTAEPFGEMSVPVLFNCLGREKAESDSIPALLVRQVQSSVYMEDTLHRLGELGVDHILEVGPGNALSGFVKKTLPGVTCVSVETPAQLDTVLNAWKEEQ